MSSRTTRGSNIVRTTMEDDQEIEIVEEVRNVGRKRKLGRSLNRNKEKLEMEIKPETEAEPDIDGKLRSAGIEVEGMSDQEKAQIWQALQESEMEAGPSRGSFSHTTSKENSQEHQSENLNNDNQTRRGASNSQENHTSRGASNSQENHTGRGTSNSQENHTSRGASNSQENHTSRGASNSQENHTHREASQDTDDERAPVQSKQEDVNDDDVVVVDDDNNDNHQKSSSGNAQDVQPNKEDVVNDDDDETQPPDDQADSPIGVNLEASTMAEEDSITEVDSDAGDVQTLEDVETQDYNLQLSDSVQEPSQRVDHKPQLRSRSQSQNSGEFEVTGIPESTRRYVQQAIDEDNQSQTSHKSHDSSHSQDGSQDNSRPQSSGVSKRIPATHKSQNSFQGQGEKLGGSRSRGISRLVDKTRIPELTLLEWEHKPNSQDHVQVQLKRRYSGAKENHNFSYFGRENITYEQSVAYTNRIIAQFDAYRLELRQAQRGLRDKLAWGEPVKAGPHMTDTLDLKARGRPTVDMSCLNDAADDFQSADERTTRAKRSRTQKKFDNFVANEIDDDDEDFESVRHRASRRNNKKIVDSEEELPDLIIEGDSGVRKTRANSRDSRSVHMGETQEFDFIQDNDKSCAQVEARKKEHLNNVYNVIPQPVASTSKQGATNTGDKKMDYIVPNNSAARSVSMVKGTPLCKVPMLIKNSAEKTDSKRRLVINTSERVLAPETQDFDEKELEEAIGRSKQSIIIEETQNQDDDFEFLGVSQRDGKSEFENPMHKSKLIGYSIPKKGVHSKVHTKVEGLRTDENEGKTENQRLSSIKEMEELKRSVKSRQRDDDHTHKERDNVEVEEKESRLVRNKGESGTVKNRLKRRKKEPVVTLAEDTQEQDADMDDRLGHKRISSGRKRLGKTKRKTFMISSESSQSEEESIPETQDQDLQESSEILTKRTKTETRNINDLSDPYSGHSSSHRVKQSPEGIGTRVIKSVKKFFSSGKSESADESVETSEKVVVVDLKRKPQNDEVECDEESQSPVLKKKPRKLLNPASQRLDYVDQSRDEAELKSRTSLRKTRGDKSVANDDIVVSDAHKTGRRVNLENVTVSKGARKLFSRPISNESNVSESSTTSSQVSVNVLDENGDLYCTQFSRGRKSKGDNMRGNKGGNTRKVQDVNEPEDVVCLDDSDDDNFDGFKVNDMCKTYSKKENAHIAQSRDLSNKKGGDISKYFTKRNHAKSATRSSTADIDLDPDLNQSRHRLPSIGNPQDVFNLNQSSQDHAREATPNRHVNRPGFIEETEDPFERIENRAINVPVVTAVVQPVQEGKIACPICNVEYGISVIEQHAADCTGEPSSQGDETRPNRVGANSSKNDIEIEIDGEGGMQLCVYCEKTVPANVNYASHVENCRAVAERQQMEIEQRGYNEVFKQQEPVVPEPRTTRNRALTPTRARTPVLTRSPLRENVVERNVNVVGGRKRRHTPASEEGYSSGLAEKLTCKDSDSADTSSWSESTDSSDEENVSLATVVRSSSRALVTGPWNKPLNQSALGNLENQSAGCKDDSYWSKNTNSPIKTFVPINQQEDSEYFSKQFNYKKDKVENRIKKRKQSNAGKKRRKKRRRVKRTKT